MKLTENILINCPNVLEIEFFISDNTLALFSYKDRIKAISEVQNYLSGVCQNWLGIRIVCY